MTAAKPSKRVPNGTPLADRIKLYSVVTESGCWEWQGGITTNGYGSIGVWSSTTKQSRTSSAHRVAYETFVGPIPDGMQVDHLCRNRACCNPEHLEVVTCRENLMRGDTWAARNAAKNHCPQGHPYDEANTYNAPGTAWRQCRLCMRAARRRHYWRHRPGVSS